MSKKVAAYCLLIIILLSDASVFNSVIKVAAAPDPTEPPGGNPEAATFEALQRSNYTDLLVDQFGLDYTIDLVLDSGLRALVFFHADWCYFCQMEKPVIDDVEEAHLGEVVVIRVNEAEHPEAVEAYNVTGFPTMFIVSKDESGRAETTLSGFKYLEEIEAALNGTELSEPVDRGSVGGLYGHNSCDFTDCLDACTDEKVINWDDIFTEFVETFTGCVPGTEAVNIPYACSKAMLTEDVNDVIGCLGNLVDLAGAPLSCAYGAGHLLADVLGAQQLGECLGQCAADSGAYGGLCQQGEQRTKCAGSSSLGFVGMDECDDCEWRHVSGSVNSCGVGEECVESAGGAECREKDEEEEDDEDDDPNKPPRPPDPPDDPDNPPDKPPKRPGYDHPDDNYGVASIFGSEEDEVYTGYGSERVAYLNRGFTMYWRYGVGRWGVSATPVTVSYLAQITPSEYPVLVIPSGGLYGLTSPSVRSNLEAYVEAGGVMIVFSQQYGSDYRFLPGGEVDGYGFREDESCHTSSTLVQSYHPSVAFAGDAEDMYKTLGEYRSGFGTFGNDLGHVGKFLNLNVDGFFSDWPEDSTLVLQRRKNGMPVEIVYPYGEGYVLATTTYSDTAQYMWLGHNQDSYLIRDSLYWALDNEVEEYPVNDDKYSTETVDINKTIYNPIVFSTNWTDYTKGDLVTIPVNVTNKADQAAESVSFELLSPSYELVTVELAEAVGANETQLLTLEYQTNSSTEAGIWLVMYRLYSGEDEVYSMYHGAFTVEGNVNMLSLYNVTYEVKDPFGEVRANGSRQVFLPPSKEWTLSVPVVPKVSGIWSLAYRIVNGYNDTVDAGVDRFAVSDIKANPSGWVSSRFDLTFVVSGPGDYFLTDSNVTFTVNLYNWGDEDRDIFAAYGFPHHVWGEGYPDQIGDSVLKPIPGTPWNYPEHPIYGKWPAWIWNTGWNVPLNTTLTVPAQSSANFTVTMPLMSECWRHFDRIWVFFYNASMIGDVDNMTSDEIGAARIGMSTYGFFTYPSRFGYSSPIVNRLTLPATEYMLSEESNYTYEIWNTAEQNFTGTFYVHMYDPDDNIFYSEGVDVKIPAGGYVTHSFNFSIPNDLPVYQQWLMQGYKSPIKIVAWTESWLGRTHALTQRQLWVKASIPTTVQHRKIVGVREDLGLNVTIQNYSPHDFDTQVNVSIPSLGIVDVRNVSLAQGATELLDYNVSLPTVFQYGSHDIYVTLISENITIVRTFYTPDSELIVTPVVGESGVTVTVRNTGGLDVNHTSTVNLYDGYYTNLVNETEIGVLAQGEVEVWSYPLPANLTLGGYLLRVSIHDEPYDRYTNLSYTIEMGGIEADMTSETDRKVYADYEDIEVQTSIINHGDPIEDASLSLKVLGDRPCVIPYDDMEITEDTVLCPGTYSIKDEGSMQGIITIMEDNVVLDCNGATLDGIDGTGFAIRTNFHSNVTIKNCNIRNFDYGIYASGGEGVIVVDNVIDEVDLRGIHASTSSGYFGNNQISNTYRAFQVASLDGSVFADNNITDCTRGFDIIGSDDNIFHSNTITGGSYGLYISSNSYNNTVMNNVIDDPSTGMWIERGKDSLIFNNTFMNSGNGIEFRIDSTNNLVTRNNFTDNTQAIQIEHNAGYNNITYNNFNRNRYGIYGQGYYTNVIIAHNNITNSENTGIYIDYWCSLIPCPQDNKIENITIEANRIENTTNAGIHLKSDILDSLVVGNLLNNNKQGLVLEGTVYRNTVVNNTAYGNTYGIYITSSSGNNTLYHNNLYNNSLRNGYNWYSIWNNDWNTTGEGNYWGDYSGDDVDLDGIGDTPYTFSIGGTDYFPFMNMSAWTPYTPLPVINFTPPSIPPTPTIPDASGSSTGAESSIWSRDLTIDVDDTLNVTSDVGTLGVTGKQYLQSTLTTANNQILSQRLWPFYIVAGDIYLTLDTDKQQYKPGEEINITYTAGNWGTEEKNLTILLTNDDTPFHTVNLTLQPDEIYSGSTTETANASFTLEGTLDGFTVTEDLEVIQPLLDVTVTAPAVVGLAPFNVTVDMWNPGNITTDVNVNVQGLSRQVSVLPGGVRVLNSEFWITENTTITFTITGDVNASFTRDVAYGENYTLTVSPHGSYPEGVIDVPFTVENVGLLPADFNINYTLDGAPGSYPVYLPTGEALNDTLSFNLTSGIHTLTYQTPLQDGATPIIVDAPPRITVTQPPTDQEANIGQKVNASITLRNTGGMAGWANATLTIPSLVDVWNTTIIEAGEEKTLGLSFTAPEDVSEKNYTATVEFMNQTYTINVLIRGVNINVTAEMDKMLYSPGENVSLALTIDNLGDLNLTLFSRVKHGDYDWIRYFNVTPHGAETLNFSVPVDFSEKLMYSVYTVQGRSVYINSAYVYMESAPGSGITLYTDKQVYQMQEHVTLMVNVTQEGVFNVTAPGFALNTTLDPGSYVYGFDLPKLRTGVYPIDYTFDNYTSWHPIDVFGYTAVALEATLDKAEYSSGETLNISLSILSNKPFDGLVKVWLYDVDDDIIGENGVNHTFTVGENTVNLSILLDTTDAGVHSYAFRIYAYGSTIWLTSGGGYFDVQDTSPPVITIISPTATEYTETSIPLTYKVNEPTQWLRYSLDAAANATLTGNTTLTGLTFTQHTVTIYGMDYANHTGTASVTFTVTEEEPEPPDDGGGTSKPKTTKPSGPDPVTLSSPENITETTMDLKWTQSGETDFDRYEVYMSTVGGEKGEKITTIGAKTVTRYTVTGLTVNTTRYFTVRVIDDDSLFADSNQVQGTTTTSTDTTPPQVTITSPTNTTTTEPEYTVTWSTDEDPVTATVSVNGGPLHPLTNGQTITGLSEGVNTLLVTFMDEHGNMTHTVITVTVTPGVNPPPEIIHFPVKKGLESKPISLYAAVSDDEAVTAVTLHYRMKGAAGFTTVEMKACPTCIDAYNASIPATSLNVDTVEYYIEASDGYSESTHPQEAPEKLHTVTIDRLPTKVNLNTPAAEDVTDSTIKLSWTPSTDDDTDNYTLYMSTSGGQMGDPVETLQSGESTAEVTGLEPETGYRFTLRVYDEAGQHKDSAPLTVTTTETIAGGNWTPILVILAVLAAVAYYLYTKYSEDKKQQA